MICPDCKAELELRGHSRFVYQRQDFRLPGHDLEAVLGSCSRCRTPVILLRLGNSTEIDGLVELPEVVSEEVLYPR